MYIQFFKKIFRLFLNHKSLFFFSFFASILIVSIIDFALSEKKPIINNTFWHLSTLKNFIRLLSENPTDVIIGLFVLIIVIIGYSLLLWLAILNVSALIYYTKKADDNDFKPTIKQGLTVGKKHVTDILSLSILTILIIYFLLNILAPALTTYRSDIKNVIVYILIMIAILCVYFVFHYALNYIVIYNHPMFDSIKKGTILFKQNILTSIEAGFIMLVFNILITFLFTALIRAVMLSFQDIAISFTPGGVLFYTFFVLSIISAIILLLIAASLSTGISLMFWTLVFIEIENKTIYSKIITILKLLKTKFI